MNKWMYDAVLFREQNTRLHSVIYGLASMCRILHCVWSSRAADVVLWLVQTSPSLLLLFAVMCLLHENRRRRIRRPCSVCGWRSTRSVVVVGVDRSSQIPARQVRSRINIQCACSDAVTMSFLPSGQIFRELQVVHETGYFSAVTSLEDHWQEVSARVTLSYITIAYNHDYVQKLNWSYSLYSLSCSPAAVA